MVTEIFGVNEDGGQSKARVGVSGRLQTIEYAHQEVHNDELVMATHVDTDVDILTPLNILIHPLTGYEVHSDFNVNATKPVRLRLYELESTDVTADGTAITQCRMNRAGDVTDTERLMTFHTPTLADTGDLLLDIHSGGSTSSTPSQVSVGTPSHPGSEVLMYPGKSYLWNIVSDEDNTQVGVRHEYYEIEI